MVLSKEGMRGEVEEWREACRCGKRLRNYVALGSLGSVLGDWMG